MWIGFGDAAVAIPKEDANYIGLYLSAPVSAITHIGIVKTIERHENSADFYLKALVKLDWPIHPGHAIRKHEYWHLKDFGIDNMTLIFSQVKNDALSASYGHLQNLLLDGPVMTNEQFNYVEEKRKSFDRWN